MVSALDQDFTIGGVLERGQVSDALVVRNLNLGLNLPADIEVKGISVFVNRRSDIPGALVDHEVRLLHPKGNPAFIAPLTGTWPTMLATTINYGSNTELWGTAWTREDLVDPAFGFSLVVRNTVSTPAVGEVDAIGITIFYATATKVGPLIGSSAGNDFNSTGPSWSNPIGALGEDLSWATVTLGANVSSAQLWIKGFNAVFMSSTPVSGVAVDVKRRCGTCVGARDEEVRLLKAGVPTNLNLARQSVPWGAGEERVRYGSVSELWGQTWTAADFLDPAFGVALAGRGGQGPSLLEVDSVKVSIFVDYQPNNSLSTSAPGESVLFSRPWEQLPNVAMVDGQAAQCVLSNGQVSDSVLATDFQFQLPPTAVITGVEFNATVATQGTGVVKDIVARAVLTQFGALGANRPNPSAWPASFTTRTYGGPTDTFGMALTPALVNSSGFGARLAVGSSPGTLGTTDTARLDAIGMRVWYECP